MWVYRIETGSFGEFCPSAKESLAGSARVILVPIGLETSLQKSNCAGSEYSSPVEPPSWFFSRPCSTPSSPFR